MRRGGWRTSRAIAALCVACGCVSAAGCGSSATKGPLSVRISLTGPTDGATVSARALPVFGTVDPPLAVLRVSGIRVRVANGAFRHWISLRRGVTRIRIVGTAPGYLPARMSIAVRSQPYHPVVARPIRPPFTNFASHANAVCSGFRDRVHSLQSSGKPAAVVLQQTIAMSETVMNRLSSLKPPAKQAAGYARLLAMTRADLAAFATLLADLRANRRDHAIQLLRQRKSTGWSEYYLARRLGLYGCTSVSAIEQRPTR